MNELDDKTQVDAEDSLPQPMKDRPLWHTALRYAGFAVVAGGSFLMLVSMFTPRLSGATRSSKLQFEERQQQIESACTRQDETTTSTETK